MRRLLWVDWRWLAGMDEFFLTHPPTFHRCWLYQRHPWREFSPRSSLSWSRKRPAWTPRYDFHSSRRCLLLAVMGDRIGTFDVLLSRSFEGKRSWFERRRSRASLMCWGCGLRREKWPPASHTRERRFSPLTFKLQSGHFSDEIESFLFCTDELKRELDQPLMESWFSFRRGLKLSVLRRHRKELFPCGHWQYLSSAIKILFVEVNEVKRERSYALKGGTG